ncbi:cytochrome c biogenesis CcdA family protein [Roseiarcus sp.]|uniref:cytochrome c biogenesis CcdA family protein n=1 Tax=Roseiarcus sp. TaxID=1969460 RepID=UPI003F982C8C
MSLIAALPLAFAAGLLAILSPCILPLAPIVVAAARADDPRGPFALAAGLAASFAIVGGALAALGVEIGAITGLRAASAAVMIAMGLVLIVPKAADRIEMALAGLGAASQSLSDRMPNGGLIGQAAAGGVLALAWAPCAGPTLGAAFALAAGRGSLAAGMLTMFVYALGAAAALLGVGFGFGRLAARMKAKTVAAASRGRFAFGLSLVAFGALILTGLDHAIETAMIAAMPDWLANAAAAL